MNHCFKMMVVFFLHALIPFAASALEGQGDVSFAVISDIRTGAVDPVLDFISDQYVDFIILPGDFYYDGQEYYPHFQEFGYEVVTEAPPERQNLYLVLGNHDNPPGGDAVFSGQIAPYYPQNGAASSPEGTLFSFDWGNCHIVITNQYWDYPGGGYTQTQLEWIEQDISSSDQRFKFVVGHEPAFPLDRHKGNSLDIDSDMRDAFWSVLAKHNVHVFFCGHTHQLSHLLYKGVYQIDAGQVRTRHADVTIVNVTDENTLITSYEARHANDFWARSPDDTDDVIDVYQTIVPQDVDSASGDIQILHEGMFPDSDSAVCFIDVVSAVKHQ